MPPGWVRDLDDYWRWLEQQANQSGGSLAGSGLDVQFIEHEHGGFVGLIVERQRLTFWDGSFLEFSIVLDDELQSPDYSFHYQLGAHQLWRKDKHQTGHDELPVHIHDEHDRASKYDEVDFEEALDQVREHLHGHNPN